MMMPVLFLSHGAPTLALEPGVTGDAWRRIAARLPQPSAILVVSAHWETGVPTLGRTMHPETIHDFGGFPDELYTLQYDAPGAPQIAETAAGLLRQAGMEAELDETRGLDHGAWIPLALMYPEASIPVLQLSVQPGFTPAWHAALGRALRPLREQGVLIVGSGAITHNLRAIFRHPEGAPVPGWVTEFCDWMSSCIETGDLEALLDYRKCAPHAAENHPTDEHLLPLFVALGAAHDIADSQHLNAVVTYGMLAMDAWLFDAGT